MNLLVRSGRRWPGLGHADSLWWNQVLASMSEFLALQTRTQVALACTRSLTALLCQRPRATRMAHKDPQPRSRCQSRTGCDRLGPQTAVAKHAFRRAHRAPQKTADLDDKELASGGRFQLGSVTSTVPELPLSSEQRHPYCCHLSRVARSTHSKSCALTLTCDRRWDSGRPSERL